MSCGASDHGNYVTTFYTSILEFTRADAILNHLFVRSLTVYRGDKSALMLASLVSFTEGTILPISAVIAALRRRASKRDPTRQTTGDNPGTLYFVNMRQVPSPEPICVFSPSSPANNRFLPSRQQCVQRFGTVIGTPATLSYQTICAGWQIPTTSHSPGIQNHHKRDRSVRRSDAQWPGRRSCQ